MPGKGLYGFAELKEPGDWMHLARSAVARCQEIIVDVAHTPPSAKVIQQMDDISDAVCQVHDAAEFCRNSHTDPAWRKAAQDTCSSLGGKPPCVIMPAAVKSTSG